MISCCLMLLSFHSLCSARAYCLILHIRSVVLAAVTAAAAATAAGIAFGKHEFYTKIIMLWTVKK